MGSRFIDLILKNNFKMGIINWGYEILYQANNTTEFLMWDSFTDDIVLAEDGLEIWLKFHWSWSKLCIAT